MVLKRIISCFAMISVVFLFSCYDVEYKDKGNGEAPGSSWAEGLTTQQIVEGMLITANMSETAARTTVADSTEVEVSWECPIDSNDWAVDYSMDGEDWTALSSNVIDETAKTVSDPSASFSITICKATIATDVYRYKFKHLPVFLTSQYIIYYKIKMKDSNGVWYDNIVSYMVLPQNRTLRVTMLLGEMSADVSSILTGYFNGCLLNLNTHKYDTTTAAPQDFTLNAFSPVFFGIETDFAQKGFGKVRHYSNSSFCKTVKIPTSNISGKTVEATLKCSFEDLPLSRLQFEPSKKFDYNDVVFKVDIIK
jgi:hypothetical protein